jgi:hypothetical protein
MLVGEPLDGGDLGKTTSNEEFAKSLLKWSCRRGASRSPRALCQKLLVSLHRAW